MSDHHLNLEDFPDSPYAYELRLGLGRLRFWPPLETEYVEVHLRRVRLRIRIYFALNLLPCILSAFDQLRQAGLWSVTGFLHCAVMLPCAIGLAWLSWSPRYDRLYPSAARVLVPLLTGLIAGFAAIGVSEGHEEELSVLTVNLFGAFFFAGLMFRPALLAAAVMLSSFAGVAATIHLALPLFMKSMMIAAITAIVAAIVYRDIETSYRRLFLEGALISDLVIRDGLSGLMNRRAFDEHLLRVWQHGLREHRPIALLMIDIDHFKQFNDRFGHQAGDRAIRSVAKAIQSFARRPLDLAARYGGEEFSVILYDLALPAVQHIANLICAAVSKAEINAAEHAPAHGAVVTVSVGVGIAVPSIGQNPLGLVKVGDDALYKAKRAGRNCVVIKGIEVYSLVDTGKSNSLAKARRCG